MPAHALASNFYEMGYNLQYCPLGFCGNQGLYNGASGTVSSGYPTPASTDTYNWALSLDNTDNNVHTWFQAGILVGLDPNNNFHSSPVFYVEIQTSTAYSFQTFPASASQHSIAICIGPSGLVCPWGTSSGAGLEARLDGSIIYNGNDPFSSGQLFLAAAFLEFHQAQTSAIPVSGSWSNLIYSGGTSYQGGPWCARPWGAWFCNGLVLTNSATGEIPNPPTPYSLIYVSQTSFDAGLLDSSGCGGGCGGGGSVAYGSMITLADGSQVPVQNIHIGDQVIVYNVPTGYRAVATVEQVIVTVANSSLTIHTTAGLPFRADANPNMRLWVQTSNGPIQVPITQIRSGLQVYSYGQQAWVRVTDVTITYGGQHTVYDLSTNPNHTTAGQILEYIANGYPDCPVACKI